MKISCWDFADWHSNRAYAVQIMKEKYIFPAVLDFADDGITIDFPDLPGCMPCADNIEQALHNAREALGLHLFNMEIDGEIIPEPTNILQINHEKNQAVILVDVFMPAVRYSVENKAVKKTLSVPQWLTVLRVNMILIFRRCFRTRLSRN